MALLSKKEIFAADDLRSETVDVPEWGGEVRIIQLSFGAGTAMFKKEVEGFDPRLRLIAACLVDEDGKPIFSEQELGELGLKSAEVMTRIWRKCVEINGLTLKTDSGAEPAQVADSSPPRQCAHSNCPPERCRYTSAAEGSSDG